MKITGGTPPYIARRLVSLFSSRVSLSQGPEIRTGFLANKKSAELTRGQDLELTTDYDFLGDSSKVCLLLLLLLLSLLLLVLWCCRCCCCDQIACFSPRWGNLARCSFCRYWWYCLSGNAYLPAKAR